MKLIKSVYFLLLVCIFLLSACGQKEIDNAINLPIKDFTFTDQNNKPFGLQDLHGKVWIADFIFTSCRDICPPMTANMAKLQKMVTNKGLHNVEFVSFSVDPTVDSPDALRKFADQYRADIQSWIFLTGYSQKSIENFALTNFKTLVKKPKEGDQVIHGTDLYLVGKDGKIKKTYSGFKNVSFDEIISDIQILQ